MKAKWTQVQTHSLPRGPACNICERVAKPGQVVLWKEVPHIGHVLLHKECLEDSLDKAPDVVYDVPDKQPEFKHLVSRVKQEGQLFT